MAMALRSSLNPKKVSLGLKRFSQRGTPVPRWYIYLMKSFRNKAWGVGLTLMMTAILTALLKSSNPKLEPGPATMPWKAHSTAVVLAVGSGTPAMADSRQSTEGERSTFVPEPSLEAGVVKAVPVTEKERQRLVPQKSQEPRRHNPAPAPGPGVTGRALPVPAGLARRPLPLFIRHVEVSGKVRLSGALLSPTTQSSPALPAEREELVLQEAERIFAKAMAPSPEESADPETYENWWRAAQERSDNYLRLALGWDRFVTLTREAVAGETFQLEHHREDSPE